MCLTQLLQIWFIFSSLISQSLYLQTYLVSKREVNIPLAGKTRGYIWACQTQLSTINRKVGTWALWPMMRSVFCSPVKKIVSALSLQIPQVSSQLTWTLVRDYTRFFHCFTWIHSHSKHNNACTILSLSLFFFNFLSLYFQQLFSLLSLRMAFIFLQIEFFLVQIFIWSIHLSKASAFLLNLCLLKLI